jgi:predicted dehydrogenase
VRMRNLRKRKEKEMTKTINCGVAGVGYLGRHHARIYHSLEGCELLGVFEPNDEAAEKVCLEYGCSRFSNLDELADACEVISVVCPTDKHAEVALPLMKKGCHLLVEKPLCVSALEAESLLEQAKDSGTILQVGHIEHYNPVMGFLEEKVDRPR